MFLTVNLIANQSFLNLHRIIECSDEKASSQKVEDKEGHLYRSNPLNKVLSALDGIQDTTNDPTQNFQTIQKKVELTPYQFIPIAFEGDEKQDSPTYFTPPSSSMLRNLPSPTCTASPLSPLPPLSLMESTQPVMLMSNPNDSLIESILKLDINNHKSSDNDHIQPYIRLIDKWYALLIGHCKENLPFVKKDLELMEDVLSKLNCKVDNPCLNRDNRTVRPLTRKDLYDKYIFKKKPKDQYSCFLLYYSGQGSSTGILLSGGGFARYDEIIDTFCESCSSDKPIVFIFNIFAEHLDSKNGPCDIDVPEAIPENVVTVFAIMSEEQCLYDSNGSFSTQSLKSKLHVKASYRCQPFLDIIIEALGSCDQCPVITSRLGSHLYFGERGKIILHGLCFEVKENTCMHVYTSTHALPNCPPLIIPQLVLLICVCH